MCIDSIFNSSNSQFFFYFKIETLIQEDFRSAIVPLFSTLFWRSLVYPVIENPRFYSVWD